MPPSASERPPRWRAGAGLIVVLALGLAYAAGLRWWATVTGSATGDGALGVILGLFICSRPAAHAVDLLFERGGRARPWRRDLAWLGLNLVTLAIGWAVIVTGAIRLAGD